MKRNETKRNRNTTTKRRCAIARGLQANRSERRRALFYFTFRNARIDDPSTPANPGSIRPELKRRRLTLAALRRTLRRGGEPRAPTAAPWRAAAEELAS